MEDRRGDGKPTGRDRRRVYLLFLVVALAVEGMIAIGRGGDYRPTMLGLAIIIASILFYAYSWFKER